MRKCPKTLDKPILLFGLELEDLGLLLALGGGGGLLFGPVVPGIATIFGWLGLLQFKKNKPQGFVLHWLYSKGFVLPGLIPPFKKIQNYGVYGDSNSKFPVRRTMGRN